MLLKEKLISGLYMGGSIITSILSKSSNIPYKELMNWYGNDIVIPFGVYFFNKLINSPVNINNWLNAAFVFLGCSALEAAQGLGLYYGIFDPKDFLAYGLGTGLALTVDKLTFRKKNLDKLVEEPL